MTQATDPDECDPPDTDLLDLDIAGNWFQHMDSVEPAIRKIDRKQVEAMAQAPLIPVTNAHNNREEPRDASLPRSRGFSII